MNTKRKIEGGRYIRGFLFSLLLLSVTPINAEFYFSFNPGVEYSEAFSQTMTGTGTDELPSAASAPMLFTQADIGYIFPGNIALTFGPTITSTISGDHSFLFYGIQSTLFFNLKGKITPYLKFSLNKAEYYFYEQHGDWLSDSTTIDTALKGQFQTYLAGILVPISNKISLTLEVGYMPAAVLTGSGTKDVNQLLGPDTTTTYDNLKLNIEGGVFRFGVSFHFTTAKNNQ